MIVYIYNIGVDLYNGFNGLRHRINWTYFTVLDGLDHPLYSIFKLFHKKLLEFYIVSLHKDYVTSQLYFVPPSNLTLTKKDTHK